MRQLPMGVQHGFDVLQRRQNIAALSAAVSCTHEQAAIALMQMPKLVQAFGLQFMDGDKANHAVLLFLFETRPIQVLIGSGDARDQTHRHPQGRNVREAGARSCVRLSLV